MLGNYSGPWLGEVMAVQRPKRATMQRQPKQTVKYNHIWNDIMMEQLKCAWLNLGNQTFSMRVENVIETSHWKLLISDIRPLHTSTALAAHFCAAAHRLGSTGLACEGLVTLRVTQARTQICQHHTPRCYHYLCPLIPLVVGHNPFFGPGCWSKALVDCIV